MFLEVVKFFCGSEKDLCYFIGRNLFDEGVGIKFVGFGSYFDFIRCFRSGGGE